jgi:WD40 repeat protein
MLRHDAAVLSALPVPGGKFVLTGTGERGLAIMTSGSRAADSDQFSNKHLNVWDAASGQLVYPPLPLEGPLGAGSVSPDGQFVVTLVTRPAAARAGPASWETRLWDLATGRPASDPLPHAAQPQSVAFAADGRCLAVRVEKHPDVVGPPRPGTFAVVVDLRTGTTTRLALPEAPVHHAALGPDGRTLVTVSGDPAQTVRAWNVGRRTLAAPPVTPDGRVVSVAWSPGGRRVALACGKGEMDSEREGAVIVWDLTAGRTVRLGHRRRVTHAVFSADGRRVATASADMTARVWEAATGLPATPPLRHRGQVNAVAFDGTGRLLATTSHDRTARVWDVATGEAMTPPLEHRHWVLGVAFDARGRVLTASTDGEVRIWDLRADRRSIPDLVLLTQVLSAHRVDDSGGLVPLNVPDLMDAWDHVAAKRRNVGARGR